MNNQWVRNSSSLFYHNQLLKTEIEKDKICTFWLVSKGGITAYRLAKLGHSGS